MEAQQWEQLELEQQEGQGQQLELGLQVEGGKQLELVLQLGRGQQVEQELNELLVEELNEQVGHCVQVARELGLQGRGYCEQLGLGLGQ